MAQAFNLTAQINLRAPGNLKPVVDTIKRELGSVTADVKVRIDPKSAKSVDAVTRKLQTMNSILVTSTKNTNNLNASLQALSASLTRTSSASTKINTTLTNNAANAAAAAKNLKQASNQMEEFGRQAFLATKRFAAFSIVTVGIYGLINAVNSGLKAFINFDKELVRLQQVTGKGAIGLAGLEKEIRNLAGTLGVSSEKLTDVATTLAQAGLSAEDTRVALAALAKTDLAPSFDDIKETTEGAIAAMRQFGIQAKDLEKSLGSINAVAAAFAVESSDLIAAIQRTGGVFASASKGVSEGSDALNEFIAIFTSVRATTRESAETIATGLRTIFTRIQRSKTIDELKLLGVELRDLEGKFVGPFEAVKRLSAALNQLDPRSGEFSGIVEELGGFRQIGKVIPLIQQFATAQEALKVAQKGQNSISDAVTTAQKSLAVQIAKVREQFLSLIAAVGKSNTFQIFLKTVLSLTSGLISLASAFKPILPFIAILGTIKGIGAITQFVSGFAGGFSKGGGSKSVGSTVASKVTGSDQKDKTAATAKAAQATIDNTSALVKLTTSVDSLSSKLDSAITSINANTAALGGSGGTTLNSGGKVMGFARGGVVPGSGNRDTVPAMLQPGEFVIRKKAVETIGTDQLHSMNKYAKGGFIRRYMAGSPGGVKQLTTEEKIQQNMGRQGKREFGLVGLYGGGVKEDAFGVGDQQEITLFANNKNKTQKATLYTASLGKEVADNEYKQLEDQLKNNYISSVQALADEMATKLNTQSKPVGSFLDEPSFASVAGNAFETALLSLGSPYLEKTEKTKALDFPLGLGSTAKLFGNIPSDIPADATRTIGGKGKGLSKTVGQIERFIESVENTEFTKSQNKQLEQQQKQVSQGDLPYKDLGGLLRKLQDKFPGDASRTDRRTWEDVIGTFGLKKQDLAKVPNVDNFYGYGKLGDKAPQFLKLLEDEGLIQRKNSGGFIKFAKGGSAEDTVPALLTPGEFVINKKAASRIGYGQLNKLNQADIVHGYNKGGYVGIRKFALGGLTPEQQELVRFKSEQSGMSPDQFIKELRKELFTAFKELKNIAPKQKELRAFSIESKERIKNIKASGADPAEQAKQLQGIKEAFIAKIQEIDPKLATAELEKRASDLMDGLDAGLNINDIIASSTELSDIFNKTVLDQDAYRDALLKLSEATGLTLNSMEELVSGLDIARDQLSEQMGEQYGEFGKLFPKLAESFGKTSFGKSFTGIANSLKGDKFKFLGEGILSKLSNIIPERISNSLKKGGLPALLGVLTTTLGSFAQNFAGNNPYAQAAAGALTTGGAYASNGAVIGQIFGPPGALAGAIVGGFLGLLEGASDAFQRTELANRLEELSKSSADLDESFVKLRADLNFENLADTEKILGKFAVQANELRTISESTLGFGAYLPTFFGGTPTDVQQEALGAELSARAKQSEAIAELAQNRLRTLTDRQIDAGVNRTQTGSIDEIYNTSTAIDELTRSLARAQGALIGDTESLEEYANRAGATNNARLEEIRLYALNQAAINAYVQRRKQEGATDNQVNEEIANTRAQVIARGKELIAEEEKARYKAEQQSRAIKAVTLQQEKLLDVYNRLGGALEKLLMQMDENIRQTDAYTNSLSGNARVIGPNRNEEDVLRNYSRYSMSEVQASAGRVSNLLGGGQAANDLTGSVIAAKVVRDQLPALLRENQGRGADDAIAALETQFQNLGLGGSEAIKEALKDIEKELATQEGGIIEGEVTGREIVEKLSTTLQAGAEASVKVLETFNEGVAKAGEELNKYNDALSKADDYFRKANSIRINSELELRRVLGKRVSLGDQSRAFNEEIRSLTRGIVPGGTTDPNLIGDFIRAESERRRQDVAANSGNLPGAGGTQAAVQSAKELALRQAESARKINDASKALNELANNAEIASNALQKIQENQRLAGASTSYLRKVMTSSSDELRDMNKDLNAYSAVMSGTAGRGDYNSLEFRQQAYRGFDAIQSLMPESMANQMQARMTRQMLQQTNPQMLGQTAYINTEGRAVSIEESLRLAETGVNTDTQQLINEYQKATKAQIDANNKLGMNQLNAAQSHYQQMQSLFAQLNTNLSNLMQEIRDSVKRDAAALRRPVDEQKDFGDRGIPASAGEIKPLSGGQQNQRGGLGLAGTLLGAVAAGAMVTGGLSMRNRRPSAPGVKSVTPTQLLLRGLGQSKTGQTIGNFAGNVKDVAAGGVGFATQRLPSIKGGRGKAGAALALVAALAGTAYAFSGSGKKEDSQAPADSDLSIAEGVMNVKNAIINIGGSTEVSELNIADAQASNVQQAGVGFGLGGLAFDTAAYSASQKLVSRTIGSTADDATSGIVSKFAPGLVNNASKIKGVGPKGSIIGSLALGGIDMGVEMAGGREQVFGTGGAQVYGSAQNLGGAALTANPLVNAINVGFDTFRTAGELMYDSAGKIEAYRQEGNQLLSDMQTKAEMVGDTGAYLWQASDEAAKAFVRPIDSSVKLGVAIYDLSEASAEAATQMQKTNSMLENQRQNQFSYNEETGQVTQTARSKDDAFLQLSGSKQIDARIQAALESQLSSLDAAKSQGIKYSDFANATGIETPAYMQNKSDEELYAFRASQLKQQIGETQEKNSSASSLENSRYLNAVAQRKDELDAQSQNIQYTSTSTPSEDYSEIYGPALPTPQNDALTAAITENLGQTTSDEVVSSQIDMLNALKLNTESLNTLTNNIGLLTSLGGGVLPPGLSAPISLDQGVPTMEQLLNQSAYNPATEAAFQDMTLPQPVPISTPSVDYGQALQEVIKEASTNGTGYASRGFDLSPQRLKTEENKSLSTDLTKSGQPGNITPYDKLMPSVSKGTVSDSGSAQLTKILGDFSINIPEFTNSVGMFGNAVNVFSKLFQNNSTENNENNKMSLDNKSIEALQGFSVSVAAFGSYVTSLSKLNIPSKIEIVGKYTFDVNITGAAAFEEMKIELTKELTDLFSEQISELNKDLYGKTGGQMGKVTPSRTNVRNQ